VSKPDRRRFELVLVDAGADGDGDVFLRLRAALKRLLRSYALRCVSVREVKAPGDDPDEGRGEPAASH
jgi:hypothetical protein